MSTAKLTLANISTPSNQDENKQLNFPKPEKFEMDIIGNLVLNLYHRSIITHSGDWCVNKSQLREEYLQLVTKDLRQKLKKLCGTDKIGTLLWRCRFLLKNTGDSKFFKIRYRSLFDFRNSKLRELDNRKINSDGIKQGVTNEIDADSILVKSNPIVLEEDNLEIDENEPKKPLEYQGSSIQRLSNSFVPTNMSCYICQEDFSTMETFEEHIQKHGDDTDFEFLTKMDKFNSPIFTMSCRLCKNSHYFCFEFESNLEGLIVEKIIIVQSRSFFYVHNTRVPYKFPENGVNRFFVDSHLFTRYVEHPIVVICHLEDSKDSRMIEQHHFMRFQELPKVNFPINPNRLPNNKTFKPKFQLANYFPPKEVQDALKDDFYYKSLFQTSNEFQEYVYNGKNLQPQTIAASLNILLQIEDMETIRQYLCLKQKNIKIRSFGDEYSFQLKPEQSGMTLENILTIYDEVLLTTRTDIFTNTEEILKLMMKNNSNIKRMENTFVGLIQDVSAGRICFKCDQKIDIHGSYTVICRPSRLNFRYQYRSLELLPYNMEFLKKFLFPDKITPMALSTKTLDLYNKNLNAEQLQAVRNMAEGPRNDATYIIFGPPGTGKTTTLVEGILQILRKRNTKILVTASSNSACDEVALRLCKYLNQLDIKRVMVRIYSRSCEVRTDTIDDELLENSNMYNGQFYPDIEILHEYRVVICTLSVVAKLATGKFGRKENGGTLYTHLIIDEVAASMEAETLMAITTVLTSNSCLIISGDNKQLGPVLQSKLAMELGLDVSLMDRLFQRDCYRVDVNTGDYDRTIQTRLIRNYRSHSAIVSLFSGLYYNHSLEAYAKPEDVSLCEIWHKSRNKQYPILFHAVYEHSESDKRSYSMYNHKELRVVMDYVRDLMYFGINGEPVQETDIGIISPYKKQYRRIQEELNLRKWFNIETGSVETFQGKEKNIIIVSFVRSGTENLGFLDNPRRLNVTLSRAKSYLILIGNPKTLSLNGDFEFIIKECQRNDTFIGSNAYARNNLSQQTTESLAGSQEKFTHLNQKMEGVVSVQNNDPEKVIKLEHHNQNRRRNSIRLRKWNEENADKNKKENKNNQSQDNGNDNSIRAVLSTANYSKDYNDENGEGEILKQQNEIYNENKLDLIIKELLRGPNPSKPSIITFTKEKLLELRIQQSKQLLTAQQKQQQQNFIFNLGNKINLSCFKNVPNYYNDDKNARSKQRTNISQVNIQNSTSAEANNVFTSEKDKFVEQSSSHNSTSYYSTSNITTDAIKKAPDSHGIFANPSDTFKIKTIENNDAFNRNEIFTGAKAADIIETFKPKSDNNEIILTSTKHSINGKDTAIAKPFTYETPTISGPCTEVSNKISEQQKSLNMSETLNLKIKESSSLACKGNTTNTTTTTNYKDDKPKANVYPMLRHPLTSFTTMSSNNVNSFASSSNVIRSNNFTSVNNSLDTTFKSNISTLNSSSSSSSSSSYANNSNYSSDKTNSNNTHLYMIFEEQATESMCTIPKQPVRNLDFYSENEKKNKIKEKKKKSCVVS